MFLFLFFCHNFAISHLAIPSIKIPDNIPCEIDDIGFKKRVNGIKIPNKK